MAETNKILIIEDVEELRVMLRLYIARMGKVEVFEATDGISGLSKAKTFKPDLILTDLNMPGMSGVEFIRAVRSTAGIEHTPIIVVTGTDWETQAEALTAGANVVIEKPIRHSVLRQSVGQFLKKGK